MPPHISSVFVVVVGCLFFNIIYPASINILPTPTTVLHPVCWKDSAHPGAGLFL